MVSQYIRQLVRYGLKHQLIEEGDEIYTINTLLDIMQVDTLEETAEAAGRTGTAAPTEEIRDIETPEDLERVLKGLLDDAVSRGLIREDSVVLRDLFDTRLMNALMPKPSQIIRTFREKYAVAPEAATDYYYDLSRASDYIRTYRVKKDLKWVTETEYGDIDITINLSKPEKDPKMIALAKTMPANSYPKCLLCRENEGYAGRINHPARQNHRIIPITIQGKQWGFQYSPYVYYNEHCIVFNGQHVPMKIGHDTFVKLFDFVSQFPHYFLGSNADLPIVGGSILSHDHFQGGNYTFAMAKAPIETALSFTDFPDVQAGIVKWPMSVIRLRGASPERLTALSDRILAVWRGYTDEAAVIYAETDQEPHNTITPIVRKRDGLFEIDLVLRNNLTTPEHPLGLYHPWEKYHHIKKENIGLIEVMGLAVLPARLKEDIALLRTAILKREDIRFNEKLKSHADWTEEICAKYEVINDANIDGILQKEIGIVFKEILECAGVFKRTAEGQEAFLRFAAAVNG